MAIGYFYPGAPASAGVSGGPWGGTAVPVVLMSSSSSSFLGVPLVI